MRILYIHNRYLQKGGEDTTVESEYNLMQSKGHTVELLLFDNADIGAGLLNQIKGGLNSIYSRTSAEKVRSTIREFKPDIVHVHNFYFTASPSIITAAHSLKVPVVVTIQNYRTICANCHLLRDNNVCELCVPHKFPWYGVKYKCYHNSAIHSALVGSIAAVHKISGTWKNKVSRYITPAHFTKNRLVKSSLDVPDALFRVKPNFIPDPGAGENNREDFYLFVGRISGEKGVEVLLKAFEQSSQRRLLIVGDGPELEPLRALYSGVHNVEYLGRQDRTTILSLMKRCKALLFPSIWYEGLPLTIIESFATGTPVIGSRLGAMQEMIQDGNNGLLFEHGKSSDLLDKLDAFESMDQEKLNRGARNSYLDSYNPEKSYADIMKIYRELVPADE